MLATFSAFIYAPITLVISIYHSQRMVNAPKGTKFLWIWDRASIDCEFWLTAKSKKGIYFGTLEKSNSVTTFILEHSIIDYEDKRNEGAISDRMVRLPKALKSGK